VQTFIGIDYHKKFSYAAIMESSGNIIKRGKISNCFEELEEFLGEYAGPGSNAVIESGYNSLVMYDWLNELVEDVTMANPLKVRLIAEAKIKTDKVDATMLAHLLRCDMIPPAHVSSPQARIGKQLLRHRMFLVRISTMVKNRIKALLDGIREHRNAFQNTNIFNKSGITWLRQLTLSPHMRSILDSDISLLEHLQEQTKFIEQCMHNFGDADERVAQVDSVPGFGRFLSLLVVSEIDDIERFARPEKLHAYSGLIPSSRGTGGKIYNGKLIKAGNKYLRWAMIEAVIPAIHKDMTLRLHYQKIAQRKGSNKAKVVVARKLLTIIFRLLKEKRYYREK
jgi:transposase